MNMTQRIACCLGLALAWVSAASAAPAGNVQSLQYPAWLDRGGLTVPVAPGTSIEPGDTLRTGAGARLLVKLEEGSLVKLGENAKFTIEKAQPRAAGGAYQAVLGVAQGAFRFTTQALAKRDARDVTIKLAQNATIGIRGTDLWGRGDPGGDLVCLIEGRIEITGNDAVTRTLDSPRQVFRSPRGAPPAPLATITQPELDTLALETEMEFGKGAGVDGEWKVLIGGFASRDQAREAARKLRTSGFPVEIGEDRTLTLSRLASELAANLLAAQWKSGSGFADIRVSR